ncbi:hypothetical protein F0310_05150 (plasmid) [Borrelia sp. A-FGy1]|uniref:hypothetical protein n=1 Tax=Borrelia sp. A-FGy1 TaxID=2608247 RepID=UPI0015F72A03|nr:hypothetical protein [Borrelia sp. A-FGy1]QMU99805.1 hypothetical protein F0310_05150 [Borrelia sp. A-FGy1]
MAKRYSRWVGGTRILNNDSYIHEGEYGDRHIILKLESQNESEIRIPQRYKNKSDSFIYLAITIEPVYYGSNGEKNNVKRVYVKFDGESDKREVFRFDTWGQKAHYNNGHYIGHQFQIYNGWYKVITFTNNTLDLLKL